MRLARHLSLAGRRGLTLIELMVALTIFTVLSYSLMSALSLSNNSRAAVENMATENEELRSGVGALSDDLRLTSESRVAITLLPDENHQVELQLPIVVAGNLGWGVPGSDLSAPGAPDKQDWLVRYTVEVDPGGAQGPQRTLVRQVVDDTGKIVEGLVLVHDLTKGTSASPGFHIEKTGEVWEVTLSTDKGAGKSEVFHVYSRN